MLVYGYARVSTQEQNLDRQLQALQEYVSDERNIITDKASGKSFERKGFNSLIGTADTTPLLREGDLLVICSLDRLGRNYEEIKKMWDYITHTLKADIKVLDMPLLDTSNKTGDLDSTFIADLVLQILSYVATKERQNILARQEQGIKAMPVNEDGKKYSKRTGRPTGRPTIKFPAEWESLYSDWKAEKITAVEFMKKANLKKTTFYKLKKIYEKNSNDERKILK